MRVLFFTNEIRVDDWGWLVSLDVGVVGGPWDVVVGGHSLIERKLTILKYILSVLIYLTLCSL